MIYDVAIIGSGPGGYTAAFRCRSYGMSVILFEKDNMGGTCLNRGCVPTKYLSYISSEFNKLSELSREGICISKAEIDFGASAESMLGKIKELRNGLLERLEESKVEIVKGKAFVETASCVVCNKTRYSAKNIIIATGSECTEPIVNNSISSDEFLAMKTIPGSLGIIGGGVVAVEFASIFRELGVDVSLYIRSDRILRKWDKDIALGVTHILKKKGLKIHKNCDQTKYSEIKDEMVLSAVGRKHSTESVDHLLVDFGPSGGIVVDENGLTKTKNIYAIGDVIEGSSMLAHTAMKDARKCVDHIAGKINAYGNSEIKCIYINPEVASVGLTEDEARETGISVLSTRYVMTSNARVLIASGDRQFIKIVAAKDNGRIIGAQMLCDRATDMVSEFALAIDNGMTINDMLRTTRPHPSYGESISESLELLSSKWSMGIL